MLDIIVCWIHCNLNILVGVFFMIAPSLVINYHDSHILFWGKTHVSQNNVIRLCFVGKLHIKTRSGTRVARIIPLKNLSGLYNQFFFIFFFLPWIIMLVLIAIRKKIIKKANDRLEVLNERLIGLIYPKK